MLRNFKWLVPFLTVVTPGLPAMAAYRVNPAILTRPAETGETWRDGTPKRIAATQDGKGTISLIYLDSVMIESESSDQLNDFVRRFSGSIEKSNATPDEIRRITGFRDNWSNQSVPTRFDSTRLPAIDLNAELAAAGITEPLIVSSPAAGALMALVLSEKRRGLKISLRNVATPDVLPFTSAPT